MAETLPRLDDLVTATRLAAGRDEPRAQLHSAIALGRELGELSDALVERFVSEARAAGLSWTEIGEVFGTSKQAAQKRYGVAGAAVGMWPERLAEAAQRAMDCAAEAARELGHNYVGTEHVLLGLIETESGLAAHVLADLGVTRERVLGEPCVMPVRDPRPHAALGVMPRLKRALELASSQAERLGHRQVNTEHLLAAIVQDPDALAVRILDSLGVSAADVRTALALRLQVDEKLLVMPRRRRRRLGRAAA